MQTIVNLQWSQKSNNIFCTKHDDDDNQRSDNSGYAVSLPSVATPKLPFATLRATSHSRKRCMQVVCSFKLYGSPHRA